MPEKLLEMSNLRNASYLANVLLFFWGIYKTYENRKLIKEKEKFSLVSEAVDAARDDRNSPKKMKEVLIKQMTIDQAYCSKHLRTIMGAMKSSSPQNPKFIVEECYVPACKEVQLLSEATKPNEDFFYRKGFDLFKMS